MDRLREGLLEHLEVMGLRQSFLRRMFFSDACCVSNLYRRDDTLNRLARAPVSPVRVRMRFAISSRRITAYILLCSVGPRRMEQVFVNKPEVLSALADAFAWQCLHFMANFVRISVLDRPTASNNDMFPIKSQLVRAIVFYQYINSFSGVAQCSLVKHNKQ